MTHDETVKALTPNLYTGDLQLVGNLTLNTTQGASAGSMNSGKILQNQTGAGSTLTVKSGIFTITNGSINQDAVVTGRGTLKVGGAGEVDFNNSATGWLPDGDNITNDGIIKLHNTESIKLYYEPTITNNSDGVISIDVSNSLGIILNTGDTVRDILNSGEIVAQVPSAGLCR